MSHELPHLRRDHPASHIWASAQGHLYATRPGMSVSLSGASVTVDATTPDGLSKAIAAAERDADHASELIAGGPPPASPMTGTSYNASAPG